MAGCSDSATSWRLFDSSINIFYWVIRRCQEGMCSESSEPLAGRSQLLRPVGLLASPDGSDRNTLPATGGFYVQAFDGAVTLTVAGYDYDIDWTPMSAGLPPAGMAASFAARSHRT
jgi:hypothetical protein